MQRLLILSLGVVVLGACASGLPPAPTVAPINVPVHDSLSPLMAGPLTDPSDDAALLDDLAATDAADDVAPLAAENVTWDIDVRTYADHPRVQFYLELLPGHAGGPPGGDARAGCTLRAHDPRAVRGRGVAWRPVLSRADRERLLERCRQPRLRGGYVAVHAGHRPRLRPAGGFLGGRAPRPGEGDRRRRPPSPRPPPALRLALPRRGGLQRRRRQSLPRTGQAGVGSSPRTTRSPPSTATPRSSGWPTRDSSPPKPGTTSPS